MRAALLLFGILVLAPTVAACEGLSPGDNIVSDGASCTLAFLVADPTGLYFMTAGHCIAEGASATSPGYGTIGTGAFTFLDGASANGDGSPGNDFGLIRIDPAVYGDLNPKICAWEGPTGIFDDRADGGEVRHYGYGMVVGDAPPVRARSGYNLQYEAGADVFRWLGAGVPGDSGSAVIHADGRAMGVLTHLGVGAGTTNSGTSMPRAFALAETAGFDLRLVLMGEDPLAVLQEVRGQPVVVTDPAGPPATDTPTTNNTSPASGNDTRPGNATNDTAPSASPPPRANEPLDSAFAADAGGNDTPFPAPMLIVVLALGVALLRRR